MTRTVTFTPLPRDEDATDLAYVERASRERSFHLLLQDSSPARSASRRQFILCAFRELVARYNGLGRIEHPLALLRGLVGFLESLAKRVDCRVDDFAGLGIYLLARDADTAFLLASSDGHVRVSSAAGFAAPSVPGLPGVRALPLAAAGAQKELFERSFRDFLGLYRIDRAACAGPAGELIIVMGGAAGDIDAAIAAESEPGTVATAGDSTRAIAGISRGVVWAAFAPAPAQRLAEDAPRRMPGRPRRRLATAMATVIVAAAVGLVWWGGRGPRTVEPQSADVLEGSGARVEGGGLRARTPAGERVAATREDGAPGRYELVPFEVAWRQHHDEPVTTTPVVAGDMVVFGCRDGRLYAVDEATGEERWRHTSGEGIGASPLRLDAMIIAADYAGDVVALDMESGASVWKAALGTRVTSTPAALEGEIVVGGYDGSARALSAQTGRELWRVRTGGRIRASVAADKDAFYVPSYDGGLYALARGSGHRRWVARPGGAVASSPAVAGGRVVVGGQRGLHAYDTASGEVVWTAATGGAVNGAVAIEGARVYAGCDDGHVYCVDAATGEVMWKTATGDKVFARPLVAGDAVVVGSYDNQLYGLDAETGAIRARLDMGAAIFSSPVPGGTRVYFGTNGGEFFGVEFRRRRAS